MTYSQPYLSSGSVVNMSLSIPSIPTYLNLTIFLKSSNLDSDGERPEFTQKY